MSDYKEMKKRIKSVPQDVGFLTYILYGKSNTGKTTLAASFPNSLMLDIREKGHKSVRKVKGLKMAEITAWQDLVDMYWYLKKEEHPYENVFWDTAGNAQMMAVEVVMKKHNKKGKPGHWGTMTQQMWGEVASMVKDLALNYRDLNREMNVGFIAHHKVFEKSDEDAGIAIDPHVGPALSPSVAQVLNAAVDIIGETFIGEKILITRDKKTGKKEEERDVNYYLRVGPNGSHITKVRNDKNKVTPDVIKNPDYKSLIKLME